MPDVCRSCCLYLEEMILNHALHLLSLGVCQAPFAPFVLKYEHQHITCIVPRVLERSPVQDIA